MVARTTREKAQLFVVVHPARKQFRFLRKDEWNGAWHVEVASPPLKSAANHELEKECTRFFGVPVRITRGKNNPRKWLEIDCSPEQAEQKLSTIF